MQIHCLPSRVNHPDPIMFPDLATLERQRARREAARLAGAARQAEALRIATFNGYDEGEQAGYVEGAKVGFWCGLVIGSLATGTIGALVYALRAWAASL